MLGYRSAGPVARWLRNREANLYGDNDYVILRRSGGSAATFYSFAAVINVSGGTGNHNRALRTHLDASEQPQGEQHWAVIGPAHDGQRRMILIRTATSYETGLVSEHVPEPEVVPA